MAERSRRADLLEWADGRCRLRSISVIFATDRRSLYFRAICNRYKLPVFPQSAACCWATCWRGRWRTASPHAQYPAAVGDHLPRGRLLIRVYARMGILKNTTVCAEQCVAVARVIDRPLTILHANCASISALFMRICRLWFCHFAPH